MAQNGGASSKQQFYFHEFPGGELSVVPEGWIFNKSDGQLQCRWASSPEKIKQASIPNPNCQTYKILKLKGKRAVLEDDIGEKDPVKKPLPKKRERRKRRSSSDSSLSSDRERRRKGYKRKGKRPSKSKPPCVKSSAAVANHSHLLDDSNNYGDVSATKMPPKPSGYGDISAACSPPRFGSISNQSSSDEIDANGDEQEQSSLPPIPRLPTTPPSTSPSMSVSQCSVTVPLTDFKKLFYLCQNTNEAVIELREEVRLLREEIAKLKVSHTFPEDVAGEMTDEVKLHKTKEEFEEFCGKLTDSSKSKALIKYLECRFVERNIGETVRSVLRAMMTDHLMLSYNRTGANNKFVFPQSLEHCIHAAAKIFHKENTVQVIRNGTTMTTTVKNEVAKQIETFLANAKTRIKRSSRTATVQPTDRLL